MTGQHASRRIESSRPVALSIGVLAWNEEEAIGAALHSLFEQSVFEKLEKMGYSVELLCITNGCTDRTPAIASDIVERQNQNHPRRGTFTARVCDICQRGKNNAWNLFVHQLSCRETAVLALMDGDIVLQDRDTIWNMYEKLLRVDEAAIATDEPIKDVVLKDRQGVLDRLSLAMSRLTQSSSAQVTGQLYCIRAATARGIYLPRDLVACEDGFIKSLVCTSFLTANSDPARVVQAEHASHVFQAYTSPMDILRNQKRQAIGQTIVHILIDRHLATLSLDEKLNLSETIREWEVADPSWLKRLIAQHLHRSRFFWRLYPNLVSSRLARLRGVRGVRKILYAPVAGMACVVALVAAWLARRTLVNGHTDYWPDTRSPGLKRLDALHTKRHDPVVGRLMTDS